MTPVACCPDASCQVLHSLRETFTRGTLVATCTCSRGLLHTCTARTNHCMFAWERQQPLGSKSPVPTCISTWLAHLYCDRSSTMCPEVSPVIIIDVNKKQFYQPGASERQASPEDPFPFPFPFHLHTLLTGCDPEQLDGSHTVYTYPHAENRACSLARAAPHLVPWSDLWNNNNDGLLLDYM